MTMKWTFPNNSEEGEERAAGFVLFRTIHQHRQYLLLRHRDGGHWAFPKGRLEREEGEIEAALRETLEETGIRHIRPIPDFRETSSYIVSRNGQAKAKTVAYFLAEAAKGDVSLSSEHTDYQWLELAEAVATVTYAESQRILTEADAWLVAASERERDDRP